MNPAKRRIVAISVPCVIALLLGWLIATAPRHPVAMIRVVDAAGKPVAGATIKPEGLRTKPGPYVSGGYSWRSDLNGVTNPPVITDVKGYAYVPYPKYVFEQIETGTLCLAVDHPVYVPDRPERVVATAPPAGAPWRERVDDLWNRIRHKALVARLEPIVLQRGAVLEITAQAAVAAPSGARLFAQAPHLLPEDTNSWLRPEPGVIVTRRLAAGRHSIRVVRLDPDGSVWFSDVTSITATADQTNALVLPLNRAVTVRGQLSEVAVRPVTNGRVVAHVWPQGANPQDDPPQWHQWAAISADGSFEIGSLPSGNLEIVALCQGYVSTNGPGQFAMRYPQKHVLSTNDLDISIGMEPTTRLEVKVTDEHGQPLKDVKVVTWPNVRYGEWAATILAGDCYNMSERLLGDVPARLLWENRVPDFQGMTDSTGIAVIPNLPADVKEFSVDHPRFALPAVTVNGGDKRRQASITLIAGQTNRTEVQLEPREQSPIRHY